MNKLNLVLLRFLAGLPPGNYEVNDAGKICTQQGTVYGPCHSLENRTVSYCGNNQYIKTTLQRFFDGRIYLHTYQPAIRQVVDFETNPYLLDHEIDGYNVCSDPYMDCMRLGISYDINVIIYPRFAGKYAHVSEAGIVYEINHSPIWHFECNNTRFVVHPNFWHAFNQLMKQMHTQTDPWIEAYRKLVRP